MLGLTKDGTCADEYCCGANDWLLDGRPADIVSGEIWTSTCEPEEEGFLRGVVWGVVLLWAEGVPKVVFHWLL